MGRGAWWAAVHGVAKSQTQLSNFAFTFHFHALGKAMATHSSVLAWRIPGTGEPGGLLSMGSHRVGHDWRDLAAAAAAAACPIRNIFLFYHLFLPYKLPCPHLFFSQNESLFTQFNCISCTQSSIPHTYTHTQAHRAFTICRNCLLHCPDYPS